MHLLTPINTTQTHLVHHYNKTQSAKLVCKQKRSSASFISRLFIIQIHPSMEELFTKKLSQTDIDYRLAFPTASLDEFPINAGINSTTFRATDTSGREWEFKLTIRRNDSNGPKPVLSGDWLRFVSTKGLKKDDRIILYKHFGSNGVGYRIKVEKRIFGVWANMR